MALFPNNIFQPKLLSIPLRFPGAAQWSFRLILFIATLFSFPLIIILIPLSILFPLGIAILPLHPHNVPPHCSFFHACSRGWWAYIASGFLWSVTSIGIPPDHGSGVSRWLARRGREKSERVAEETGVNGGRLVISEDFIPPLPRQYCVGANDKDDLPRNTVHGFWLDSNPSLTSSESEPKRRKAILWIAGGGYVTGYPLNDRPIFSLARALPSGYRILAPCITRALSIERSFPVPLLDALAAYAPLRMMGYAAENIAIIGNSAGGGLAWSVLSYLVALDDGGWGMLGVPRAVVMISPWVKLPPAEPGIYPDFVNTPQLTNAANCYLARYPGPAVDLRAFWNPKEPINDLDWLDESFFSDLSTHHPLISPSADISSPFVRHTLGLLAVRRTKLLIHCGTAEWFRDPIVELAGAAQHAGVDIDLVENEGGLHSEACLSWPERGGPAELLQRSILACLVCERR